MGTWGLDVLLIITRADESLEREREMYQLGLEVF